jgi:polyhydroxyalkanoate synthesis regulator phasin
MAMYDWEELLNRWEHKKLTVEQAIGQLLQWGQATSKTLAAWPAHLEALKRQVVKLAQRVDALERQFEALESRPKRRRSR